MRYSIQPFTYDKFDFVELNHNDYGIDVSIRYHIITPKSLLMQTLNALTNDSVIHARIHHQTPSDFISEHTDTAFPQCDALIFRLDSNAESRLFVNHKLIGEKQWHATIVPHDTPHNISVGFQDRYSLVAWCQRDLLYK